MSIVGARLAGDGVLPSRAMFAGPIAGKPGSYRDVRETAGNKKPDIIIGLELARQAGKSVFPASDVHHGALRLRLA